MSQEKQFYCAIDLGTTNTVIAWGQQNLKTKNFEAKIIDLKVTMPNREKPYCKTVSSSVLFENDSSITVGEIAKHVKTIFPEKVVTSVKNKMGTNHIFNINNKNYTPEEISSYILNFALNGAKELFGEKPTDVIITVPASFDSEMRTATLKAAELSGINNDSSRNILLDEPRAAMFNFIDALDKGEYPNRLLDLERPKNVLVYDLGGGTLDVSLHKLWRNTNFEVEIEDYAISLHTLVGGDNFDNLLAQYFYSQISDQLPPLSDIEHQRVIAKLTQNAEVAKKLLTKKYEDYQLFSPDKKVEIEILHTNIFDGVDLDEILSMEEYENIISPLLAKNISLKNIEDIRQGQKNVSYENIIYPILDVLIKAEDKAGAPVKVDAILLNGGMTKLPIIKNRIKNFFGIEPISIQDPDLSVALGAVYYHYGLHQGKVYSSILNDTIGIEVSGNFVHHLAKAGVTLPYISPVYDNFKVLDGTTIIELPFYMGNRKDTLLPNRKITNRSYTFAKALLAEDKISIQIEINIDNIMIVKGWINDDKDKLFILEVDYTKQTVSDLIVENKPKKDYKDTFENCFKQSDLNQLYKLCNTYERTHMLGIKNTSMEHIKQISTTILSCSNKNTLAQTILIEIKNSKSIVYNQRLVLILGQLLCVISLTENCKKYFEETITKLEQYNKKTAPTLKSYYGAVIVAIGNSQEISLAPILEKLLYKPLIIKNYGNELFISLGKISNSLTCFCELIKLINTRSNNIIQIFWAIGKIGSREKVAPLPINKIENHIYDIIEFIKQSTHHNVQCNAIYAIAEICDRRFKNSINEVIKKDVLKFLEKFKPQFSNQQQKNRINKLLETAITLIDGNELSQEQKGCLLAIRSQLEL
ncbi:hypothetical protein AN641_02935 [Candidatus Epulonipiscioides gigas]|nr:hypothetical protein AN641_02935 [Epulopiscium sp. SCG-C07WGA-EpuloA2]